MRETYGQTLVELGRESQDIVVLDADLRVISANRCFYQTFKVTPEEVQGQSVYELGNRQWDIPKLREALLGALEALGEWASAVTIDVDPLDMM